MRIRAEGCVGGRTGEQLGGTGPGQLQDRPTAAAPIAPRGATRQLCQEQHCSAAPSSGCAETRSAPGSEASKGRRRFRPALRRPLAGAARHNAPSRGTVPGAVRPALPSAAGKIRGSGHGGGRTA